MHVINLIKNPKKFWLALFIGICSNKGLALPEFHVNGNMVYLGEWGQSIEPTDFILRIDPASPTITHVFVNSLKYVTYCKTAGSLRPTRTCSESETVLARSQDHLIIKRHKASRIQPIRLTISKLNAHSDLDYSFTIGDQRGYRFRDSNTRKTPWFDFIRFLRGPITTIADHCALFNSEKYLHLPFVEKDIIDFHHLENVTIDEDNPNDLQAKWFKLQWVAGAPMHVKRFNVHYHYFKMGCLATGSDRLNGRRQQHCISTGFIPTVEKKKIVIQTNQQSVLNELDLDFTVVQRFQHKTPKMRLYWKKMEASSSFRAFDPTLLKQSHRLKPEKSADQYTFTIQTH